MSIVRAGAATGFACIFASFFLVATSVAQTSSQDVMKQCGERWQAAKAANTTGNQTWPEFLSKCRSSGAQAPAAAPIVTAQARTTEKPAPSAAKPASSAVFPAKIDPKYANEKPGAARRKTCTDQYNANKAKNANGGLKWIQKGGGYFSECNRRLGGGRPA